MRPLLLPILLLSCADPGATADLPVGEAAPPAAPLLVGPVVSGAPTTLVVKGFPPHAGVAVLASAGFGLDSCFGYDPRLCTPLRDARLVVRGRTDGRGVLRATAVVPDVGTIAYLQAVTVGVRTNVVQVVPDDVDGDGWSPALGDCDDADPARHPSAPESCTGVDANCDGFVGSADHDGDGVRACDDCDDGDVQVGPGASEVCYDGRDNDCDGTFDRGQGTGAVFWQVDEDGDSWVGPQAGPPRCIPGPRHLHFRGMDCDDADPSVHWREDFLGFVDACDGVDEDCDGLLDDHGRPRWQDADGDGFSSMATSPVQLAGTSCGPVPGWSPYPTDCDDADAARFPGAPETCTDPDLDCDGYAGAIDNDGDGYGACQECDDGNAAVWPGSDELCGDDLDNDCDGGIDDALAVDAVTWFPDLDGDGFGDAAGAVRACSEPATARRWVSNGSDCDDLDAAVSPAAEEVCRNGVDDDCDGRADEAACTP